MQSACKDSFFLKLNGVKGEYKSLEDERKKIKSSNSFLVQSIFSPGGTVIKSIRARQNLGKRQKIRF